MISYESYLKKRKVFKLNLKSLEFILLLQLSNKIVCVNRINIKWILIMKKMKNQYNINVNYLQIYL